MNSAWFYLIVAGLLEAAWAVGLKYTEAFSRFVPSVLTISAIGSSLWLLSLAAKSVPIGTAYAIWVGIGATGAAILGMILFKEPVTIARCVFLTLLVIAIIGLKVTSQGAAAAPHT